jgi:hypothetical protein
MQKDNAIQHQSITNSQVVVDEIEMLVLVQIVQYSFKTDKRKRDINNNKSQVFINVIY